MFRKITWLLFGLIFLPGTVLAAWEVNEMGRIPVLEYHRIDGQGDQFGRTAKEFKDDLLWLYNNGYFLISVSDFLGQNFAAPKGKKPFMITFDDAHPTQFWIKENGVVDPDSAVAILDGFFKQHPDFGSGEMFFVNPSLFGQPDLKRDKLMYLLQSGRELGNHTVSHANLRQMSAVEIQKELGLLQGVLNEVLGKSIPLDTLAYPFGGLPKGLSELSALQTGNYDNVSYNIRAGFLVGADPSHPPYHSSFESLYIPRIQAIDDEWQRWFGRLNGETDAKDESESFYPFVSDGDPKIVSVLAKHREIINYDLLAKGLKVCFMDEEGCVYHEIENFDRNKAGLSADFKGKKIVAENDTELLSVSEDKSQITKAVPSNEVPKGDFFQGIWQMMPKIQDWRVKFDPGLYVRDFKIRMGLPKMRLISGAEGMVLDIVPQVKHKRGIYWTAYTASGENGQRQADKLKQAGGNTIVFDVKEVEGKVFYDSKVPLAIEIGAIVNRLSDVSKLVRDLHRRGFYVVARMVLFKDEVLAQSRSEFTIKDASGRPWQNREGLVWVDPSHPGVIQYNLAILKEVARFGVDEIQFDYVRFPALGDTDTNTYWFEEHSATVKTKQDAIVDFLRQARQVVLDEGVALSADVFGVVAWNDGVDGLIVGQDIKRMAQYLDAMYPMIYPSHFGPGFAGRKDPANDAYFFIKVSTEKFLNLVEGTSCEIRPWLQGFTLRVNNFGPAYIQTQVKALEDIGVKSFLIWNAANNYESAWGAF